MKISQKNVKLDLDLALKIHTSKKDFFLYKLDDNNLISNFILTNDLTRYRLKFDNNFKLVSDLKPQVDAFTIEL